MSDFNFEQLQEVLKGEDKEVISKIVTAALQTEQGASVLNNHLKTSIDTDAIEKAARSEASSKAYGHVEDVLKEFGYEKQKDEKATALLSRALKDMQTNANKKGATEEDKEKYEKALKAIQEESESKVNTWKSKYEAEVQNNRNGQVSRDLLGAKSKIKVSPSFEGVFDRIWAADEKALVSNSTIKENGQIVYNKPDGTPYISKVTFGFATAEEILKDLYKDFMETNTPGGALGKENTSTHSDVNGKFVPDMTRINKRSAFQKAYKDYAAAQGIATRSDEYKNGYSEAQNQFGYYDLPEG